LLIITADHGCDPTTKGTDHTREYVPVLVKFAGDCCDAAVLGEMLPKEKFSLGTRESLADIAATLCKGFGLGEWGIGVPFELTTQEVGVK